MPLNGYSVGKDVTVTLNMPNGILRIKLTAFDAKPVYYDLRAKPLGDPTITMSIPDGWKISAKCDRQDATLDDFCAQYEAAYWAGQNVLTGSITETITEVDGTTSRYRYTNVNLKVTDPGSWSSEKLVDQTLEADASRRLKL